MHINPYLNFGGHCAAAFAFYQQRLGARMLDMLPFRGSPAEQQTPEHWRDKIMHAALEIGGTTLMGTDGMAEQAVDGIKGCSIVLHADNEAEAERLFNALAEEGKVSMPMQATFWARKFGMLNDRFGLGWMVMYEGHAAPGPAPA